MTMDLDAKPYQTRLRALDPKIADGVTVETIEVSAGYRGTWLEEALVIKPATLDWLLRAAEVNAAAGNAPTLSTLTREP